MALLSLLTRRDEPGQQTPMERLEQILVNLQNERRSIETLLASASAGEISSLRSALDEAERRASTLGERLDDLGTRAEQVAQASRGADALESRQAALEDAMRSAEVRADQSLQQATATDDQCRALQEATAAAQTMLARLESLKADGEIAGFAEQVSAIRVECERIRNEHSALLNNADLLRARTGEVMREADAAVQISRDACGQVEQAGRQVQELEHRIDAIAEVEAIRQDTTAQLQTLNALAEHVSTKVKALEGQHQTVERALVESRRISEMVWDMESQIGKLNEGSTLASRVEEDLVRLERLHHEVTAKLEEAARGRRQFTEQADQQQRDAIEMLQAVRGHLDRLAVRKKELDTVAERLRAVHGGLAEAERRLTGVSAAEKTLSVLGERLEVLSSRIGDVTSQTQALEQKQASLPVLEERLSAVDQATRRATAQIEALTDRSKDLEALQAAFETFDKTYAAARTLVDDLHEEKEEFARFAQQVGDFMNAAPETGTAIAALQGAVTDTRTRAAEALAMEPRLEELATRLTGLAPRLQVLDDLQTRLSGLHELSREIDRKLTAQLARQSEIDQVRVACDGLLTQTVDARHKLEDLESAQARLTPLAGQLAQLSAEIAAAHDSLTSLAQDRESIDAQERRLVELGEAARGLFREISSRFESMHALKAELGSAVAMKQELYGAVAQLEAMQREASACTRETGERLDQLALRWTQIEERRSHLASVEQAIASVETRSASLEEVGARLTAKLTALADRERIVQAVKEELETIHEISSKSQEDLAAVADRRGEIADARAELEQMAAALVETRQKMADVERRAGAVDEVRRKADAVVRLLDDVRVTLDAVGEQKAMVDHVGEMLTRLDHVLSEARGTAKSLQDERKLAQRIAENVRHIHARAAADISQVG